MGKGILFHGGTRGRLGDREPSPASTSIILYYFAPKQRNTYDTFDVWLTVEFDKHEANFNSFGFSFGPCYKVHLGEITL